MPALGTSSTFNDQTFWNDFLDLMEPGGRTSDVSYYLDKKATAEDYKNAIKVIFDRTTPGSEERKQVVQLLDDAGFWAPTDDLNYWVNADASDTGNIADLQKAGAERLPNLFNGPGGTPGKNLSGGNTSTDTADPSTALKILSSPSQKLFRDPNTGKFYMTYDLPNSGRKVLFEISDDQMTALYGDVPPPSTNRTFRSLTGDQNITFSGNIAEMAGEGSFESEVERVTVIGLDEGRLPSWAEDTPEIRDLIYIAQAEQKSTEWLLDKISTTAAFQARFPNINKLKNEGNLSIGEAVTGFLEMEAGIRSAIKTYGGTVDVVTPQVVGDLIDKGYSLETAQSGLATLDRMQKFAPAFDAFNAVLVSQGQAPVSSVQEYFDFMSGNAPQEAYDLWEASSVSEAANAAGLGAVFSANDAMKYALYTQGNTTLADATGAFQSASQLLLRLRNEVEVEKFGLTTEELIDLSLGQPLATGRSAAEVQDNINRAVLSAQKSLQSKAQPYTGYTTEGTPQRASLSGLRQG